MLQYLLLLVVAFFAYQWKGWPAALGVVVAYIVIVALYRMSRAQAAKQRAEEELRKAGGAGNPEAQTALARASSRLDVAAKK